MSQENVQIIRRAIEAFNAGDVDDMLALADPELEWRPAFGAATDGATAYHGHVGFRVYWRGTQDIWDHFHFEPEQFIDDGTSVVVVGRGSGRAKGSGIEIDQPFAMLWKVRNGKTVFGQTFTDPDEARAAAERLAHSSELILRAIFDRWAHGDLTAGTELLAEDIRFSAAQPEGQVRGDGRAAMRRFMRDFLASWERYWIELNELEQRSPVAFLASGTQHGIGKGSHVQTSMPTFIAIRFRDDEIAQLEFFYERAGAVAALAE